MNTTDEMAYSVSPACAARPQRVAIVHEIFSCRHPKAHEIYEIYESVRRNYPNDRPGDGAQHAADS